MEIGRDERGASRFFDRSEGVISGGGASSVDLDMVEWSKSRSEGGREEERARRARNFFEGNVSQLWRPKCGVR